MTLDPSKKFIDSFRFFHPLQRNAFTCWCTVTGARQTNYGTRIDYIFADTKLCKEAMMESTILVDIKGSDHCPVKGVFDAVCLPSRKPPSLCSTYWPEFSGKQVKVSDYFHRGPTLLKAKLTSLSESTQNHTMTKRSIPQNDTQKYKRITSSQKRITTFMNLNSESRKPEGCLSNGCGVSFTDSSSETFDSYKNTEGVVELSTLQQSEVKRSESAIAWRMLLKGPKPPPLCKGHNEPCVLRIVKKPGQNFGREFYVCARPGGHDKDPAARCNHFQWLK